MARQAARTEIRAGANSAAKANLRTSRVLIICTSFSGPPADARVEPRWSYSETTATFADPETCGIEPLPPPIRLVSRPRNVLAHLLPSLLLVPRKLNSAMSMLGTAYRQLVFKRVVEPRRLPDYPGSVKPTKCCSKLPLKIGIFVLLSRNEFLPIAIWKQELRSGPIDPAIPKLQVHSPPCEFVDDRDRDPTRFNPLKLFCCLVQPKQQVVHTVVRGYRTA